MMLLAFALIAIVSDAVPARTAAPPPLRVTYAVARTVSPTLVKKMLSEADALWRPAGITFAWEPFEDGRPAATLLITVEDFREPSPEGTLRLGWLLFDSNGPARVLHVSYANASTLLEESSEVVGNPNRMPISERETYLGRAMGRALAHELGHYLLGTKTHSATGLMRGTLSAETLFSPIRARLEVPRAIRESVLARLSESGLATANP
jgi:hypothetical protein